MPHALIIPRGLPHVKSQLSSFGLCATCPISIETTRGARIRSRAGHPPFLCRKKTLPKERPVGSRLCCRVHTTCPILPLRSPYILWLAIFMKHRERPEGLASSALCPREGYVKLRSVHGEFGVLKVNCKTWRCLACRDRLKSLFKSRVATGVSALGQCVFMTFTYKVVYARYGTAEFVKKDWKAFWRRWKSLKYPNLKWFRVTEMTKKRMPHHHVVMGPIPSGLEMRCYGIEFDYRRFIGSRWYTCECLSHKASRIWWEITKDSWNTHVVPVLGERGAAAYMGKYLGKGFALANGRRWSSSRGWPGAGRMRLQATVDDDDGWVVRTYFEGHLDDMYVDDSIARAGTRLEKAYHQLEQKRSTVRKLGGYIRVDKDVR